MESYSNIYRTIAITSKKELKQVTKMKYGTIVAEGEAKEAIYKVLHP